MKERATGVSNYPMRLIHITNGHSTRVGLERSGLAGDVHSWHDVLHDGPTPAGLPREEWRRTRVAHLASRYGDAERIAQDYARADAALERWHEHDEMVFWFEHDLYDQLILLHHLDWLSRITNRAGTTFSLVCGDTYLGGLKPELFLPMFDGRQAVTDAQVKVGKTGWAAFCAPDPAALESFVAGDTSSLPYLAGALRRHFEDYPSSAAGLSRSEAQIVWALNDGLTSPEVIFAACARMEERIFMGDATFWTSVEGLANGRQPLLHLDVQRRRDRLPTGSIALTDAGRDVASARADHVALNGIDRWMGGVHLTPSRFWRWNGARLVTAHV